MFDLKNKIQRYTQHKSLKEKISLVSFISLGFSLFLCVIAIYAIEYLNKTNGWVDHTHKVLRESQNIVAAAVDMETGMRGYLLAGKEEFLEPYNSGQERLSELFGDLKKTVSDNPPQVSRLDGIQETLKNWENDVTKPMIELRRKIAESKTTNDVAALVRKKEGKIYFDRFREQIKQFIDEQSKLLSKREGTLARSDSTDEMRNSGKWVIHTHQAINMAQQLLLHAIDMETGMRGYLLTGDEEFLEPYRDGSSKFNTLLNTIKTKVSDNPAQVIVIGTAGNTIAEWQQNVVNKMIDLRREIGDGKNMDDLASIVGEARGKKYFDSFREKIATFAQIEEDLMEIRKTEASDARSFSLLSIVLIAVVSFVLMYAFTSAISESTVRKLQSVINELKKVMKSGLRTAKKMESSSVKLEENVSSYASALQEVASTMEEMSVNISKTSQNSENVLKFAMDASSESQTGLVKVEKLGVSMEAMKNNTENIRSVTKLINDISSKTNIINEIVFKTQLLSFNASIEAAAAGEHGQRFSVVADEVSKLAEISGNSANEINQLLDSSVSSVEHVIEESSDSVKHALSSTDETSDIFKRLTEQVSQLKSQINEVTVSAREQTTGVSQTKQALQDISDANQINSSLARESLGLANETTKDIHKIEENLLQLQSVIGSSGDLDSPGSYNRLPGKSSSFIDIEEEDSVVHINKAA